MRRSKNNSPSFKSGQARIGGEVCAPSFVVMLPARSKARRSRSTAGSRLSLS